MVAGEAPCPRARVVRIPARWNAYPRHRASAQALRIILRADVRRTGSGETLPCSRAEATSCEIPVSKANGQLRERHGRAARVRFNCMLLTTVRTRNSDSHAKSRPSNKVLESAVVNTWVQDVISYAALDSSTLDRSEVGFQLSTDKMAMPMYRAEGQLENQYSPTGRVDWAVGAPKAEPREVLAHIQTTWVPGPNMTVTTYSQDEYAVLSRASTGAPWRTRVPGGPGLQRPAWRIG